MHLTPTELERETWKKQKHSLAGLAKLSSDFTDSRLAMGRAVWSVSLLLFEGRSPTLRVILEISQRKLILLCVDITLRAEALKLPISALRVTSRGTKFCSTSHWSIRIKILKLVIGSDLSKRLDVFNIVASRSALPAKAWLFRYCSFEGQSPALRIVNDS